MVDICDAMCGGGGGGGGGGGRGAEKVKSVVTSLMDSLNVQISICIFLVSKYKNAFIN